MNRILLKSTVIISLAIISAIEKGLSKSDVVCLSNLANWRKGDMTKTQENNEKLYLDKAKKAGLSKDETALIVSTFGLTLSQVYYCWNKHVRTKRKINLVKSQTLIERNAALVKNIFLRW